MDSTLLQIMKDPSFQFQKKANDAVENVEDSSSSTMAPDYGYEDLALRNPFDWTDPNHHEDGPFAADAADEEDDIDYEYGETTFPMVMVVDQVPNSSSNNNSSNLNSNRHPRHPMRRHSMQEFAMAHKEAAIGRHIREDQGVIVVNENGMDTGILTSSLFVKPHEESTLQQTEEYHEYNNNNNLRNSTSTMPQQRVGRRSRRHSVSAIGEGSRLYGNRMQRRVSFGNCSVVSFDRDDRVINLDTDQEESVPMRTSITKPTREQSSLRRLGTSNQSLVSSLSGSFSDDSSKQDYDSGFTIHSPESSKWDTTFVSSDVPHLPKRITSPIKASNAGSETSKRLVLSDDVRTTLQNACATALKDHDCSSLDAMLQEESIRQTQSNASQPERRGSMNDQAVLIDKDQDRSSAVDTSVQQLNGSETEPTESATTKCTTPSTTTPSSKSHRRFRRYNGLKQIIQLTLLSSLVFVHGFGLSRLRPWHKLSARFTESNKYRCNGVHSYMQIESMKNDHTSDHESTIRTTRQYWLDLRDTALQPVEALAFLEEFLSDLRQGGQQQRQQGRQLIDCILLPKSTLQSLPNGICLDPSIKCFVVDENNPQYLCSIEGDATGFFVIDDHHQSADTILSDPMQFMELFHHGQWIIFALPEAGDEAVSTFVDEISSLVQLLPSSSLSFDKASSGLLLPRNVGSIEKSIPSQKNKGGVAFCCYSEQGVFQVESTLEQALVSPGPSLDSGILVPSTHSSTPSSCIPTAIVLPFDLQLWRSVLQFREGFQEETMYN
jgi:hypothetical protein